MVSRSRSSTSSSADLGTGGPLLSGVSGTVQAGQEPLELRAELLPRRQVLLLGQGKRVRVVDVGAVERVVLLLETGHHVADLGGVLDLGGDLSQLRLASRLEV